MKYLIDSHVAIWMLTKPEIINDQVKKNLINSDSQIYLSVVSLWEISLKFGLGKLTLKSANPEKLKSELELVCQIKVLDIDCNDAISFYQLQSFHHRDPFDRMLIWQAIRNNMIFITDDLQIQKYTDCGLQVLW
jgi:PIN domain nuclease of toxin-antitoxin system